MYEAMENTLQDNILRPVIFVVQVMSDISKQDCIHNKGILQCTKMRVCIHDK